MGVDSLDLTFRLERSFGVKLPRTFFDTECGGPTDRDMTAGQIHAGLCRVIAEKGRPLPFSSWHRTQLVIAQITRVPIHSVTPKSWLVKDLGFVG